MGWKTEVRFSEGAGILFAYLRDHTDSAVHSASFLIGTEDYFHGSKAAGA